MDISKLEFKMYVIPISFFLPRKLDRHNPALARYFMSDTKPDEKKYVVFFTVFLSIWGFATALVVATVEVIRALGLDSADIPIEPLIRITPEPIFTAPSPLTIEGFLVIAFLIGIPSASRMILPDRILSSAGIRRIRRHNIVQSIPHRNLSMMSGLWGIASFVLLFFSGVLVNEYNAYLWMASSLMFAMIIGIPICIMSLFYVYEIERRIQPKLVKYLIEELGLRVSSLEDMIAKSKGLPPEKQRPIACLSLFMRHSA